MLTVSSFMQDVSMKIEGSKLATGQMSFWSTGQNLFINQRIATVHYNLFDQKSGVSEVAFHIL